MAGLRYWDGSAWQVMLGGPPTYAYVGSSAPSDPPDGMLWVQPVDPIVDLASPILLTDTSVWSWAGFGYGYPGGTIAPVINGMQLDWNPTPDQNPTAGQLGCANITGETFDGHQMLAQMSVIVPAGMPDVRLTHAFTSSSAWITEKDTEATITLPFIWTPGMNKLFGPESTPAPPGGHVIVTDLHLFDLTSSPPSLMRVWSQTYGIWLPINDGLVQRAGDRMVGSLRFDTIDAETGQPTVTGLPTPVDITDAVPLGYLEGVIGALPDPGQGGVGLVIVDDTEPLDPETGLQWLDTSRPDVAAFTVAVKGSTSTATADGPSGVWTNNTTWPTWTLDIPCNGVLTVNSTILMRATDASTAIAARVNPRSWSGCEVTEITNGGYGIGRISDDTAVDNTPASAPTVSVFIITGIPDDSSGQIELGWLMWSSGSQGSGQYVYSFSMCDFVPYGNERMSVLDLNAGSVQHGFGG